MAEDQAAHRETHHPCTRANGSHLTLEIECIRQQLLNHLESLQLPSNGDQGALSNLPKESIRRMHAPQRSQVIKRELSSLGNRAHSLLRYFADGSEVDPEKIDPCLIPVCADDETGALFRLATLQWSVPVSRGFGRRIRFLVFDRQNGKIVGLFALGDPVFNLRDRDEWIGWSVKDREARLVHVMDAYVVGAVPPYSLLLGGKLVVSLLGSSEVVSYFEEKYRNAIGTISQRSKPSKLVLITVTSALGRSSIYNRLRLPGLVEVIRIGSTQGWGHFQVPEELFEAMRQLLASCGHPYATGYRFGQGPNWRMRVIREALRILELDQNLLRHGIPREIFAMPLYENWRAFLLGEAHACEGTRPDARTIASAALKRWVIPRSVRCPDYRDWRRIDTEILLGLSNR